MIINGICQPNLSLKYLSNDKFFSANLVSIFFYHRIIPLFFLEPSSKSEWNDDGIASSPGISLPVDLGSGSALPIVRALEKLLVTEFCRFSAFEDFSVSFGSFTFSPK